MQPIYREPCLMEFENNRNSGNIGNIGSIEINDGDEALLNKFQMLISRHLGLSFTSKQRPKLINRLAPLARDLGDSDSRALMRRLVSTPVSRHEMALLAEHLTIGESYFFRDTAVFNTLENKLFPSLIQQKRNTGRRIRLWSAGCAAGEEPYSLALLLARLIPDWETWDLMVLGTDINAKILEKARAGIYSDWSFRGVPDAIRARHFIALKEGNYRIRSEYERMVRFSRLNLASAPYPSLDNDTSHMNFIFCRNVLMYLNADLVPNIIDRFFQALVPGGWLVVSTTESHLVQHPAAHRMEDGKGCFFQKPPVAASAVRRLHQPLGQQINRDNEVSPPRPACEARTCHPVPPPKPGDQAQVFYNRGDYRSAAELLQNTGKNLDAPTSLLLSRCLANLGKATEALNWCDQSIATDKLNPFAHYLRATILQEQRDPEAALDSLRHALFLDPDFVLAHFSIGNLLSLQQKSKAARRHLSIARELIDAHYPNDPVPGAEGLTAGHLGRIIDDLAKQ